MTTVSALTRPLRLRKLLAGAATVLLAVGLAACGDDDEGTTTAGGDGTTSTAGGVDDYGGGDAGGGADGGSTIVAKDFSLTSLTVAPGAAVKIENEGSAPHTVTADDGAFDSGTVGGGSSGSITAPQEPGAYAFHCEIHSSMTGTLTVEA